MCSTVFCAVCRSPKGRGGEGEGQERRGERERGRGMHQVLRGDRRP